MLLRIIICCAIMQSIVHGELVQHPDDAEAVVGQEKVILRCRTDITDTANPVEWHYKVKVNKDEAFHIVYKRGMILNGFHGRLRVIANATTGQYDLVIPGVKLQDAGAYICIDIDSQSKAELIVFEKHPSNDFCMTNSPSDGFLGSNDCGLESDTVRMSCDLSYRGNLAPVLEWTNGKAAIASTTTNGANGATKSSIEQKADQMQTSTYTCQIKYLHSTIISNLTWSTTINLTSAKNTTNISYVGCDQKSVDCFDVQSQDCSYIWLSENGTELTSGSTISLTDKPNGNYICLAKCTVRQTSCSYVAKMLNHQCNQHTNQLTAMDISPQRNLLEIYIPVGILIVLTTATLILTFVFRRRLCNCTERRRLCDSTDSEVEEGCRSYLGDVTLTDEKSHQDSFLSPAKNTDSTQSNVFNNGALMSKELSEKNNLMCEQG